MVRKMISSRLMTNLQTLSTESLKYNYDKKQEKNDQSFSFGPVTYDDVLKKVNTLDTAKASHQFDIPSKILKQKSDYFAEYFYENINQRIHESIFPSDVKLADVTPVYKKKSKNSKDNYRPVSILPNISSIYER